MKRLIAAGLLAAACCCAAVAAAQAATVGGVYYGTIDNTSDPAFPYLSLGDHYRIQFAYDTTVPDGFPDPAQGYYPGAVSGRIDFDNGYNVTFTGGDFYTGNDVDPGDSDYLNFGSGAALTSNFPTGLYTLGGFSVTLVDFSRTVLDSDALPSAYLSAALFDIGPGGFDIGFPGIGRPGVGLTGTLTSTPIPAALPLFATALGGMGWLGWRRKRTAA